MTDVALLKKWRNEGDAEAFTQIARTYAPLVYGACLRILGNPTEAEDAAQECFVTLARTRRLPSDHLAAWLHTVAMNQARKTLRSERRRSERERVYASRINPRVDPTWDDIREHIDEAIANLPKRYQEPLVTHFLMGETRADIAARLGVARQTVSYRIGKGVDRVRRDLKRKGIVLGATALGGMLAANAAQAVPPALVSELGKLAVAGKLISASLVGVGMVGFAKGAALAVCGVAIVIFGIATWFDGTSAKTPAGDSPDHAVPSEEHVERADPAASVESPGDTVVTHSASDAVGALFAALGDSARSSEPRISGVVVLPDGKPFAQANVTLIAVDNDESVGETTAAGADGTFRFYDTAPANYRVCVADPSVRASRLDELTQVKLTRDEAVTGVRLVYGKEGGLAIAGRIENTRGERIAGAEIMCYGNTNRRTSSGKDGTFRAAYLEPGNYNVCVSAKGYTNYGQLIDAGEGDVVIVLLGKGNVEGRVVRADTGQPLTKFEVGFINGHREGVTDTILSNMNAFVDVSGSFRLDDVYVGDLTIAARANGFSPAYTHIVLAENETVSGIKLRLEAGRPLRGRVQDVEGKPVPRAKICFGPIDWPEVALSAVVTETDESGVFDIRNASPDLHVVSAHHPKYVPGSARVGGDMVITLEEPTTLKVTIAEGGEPLHKAHVRVSSPPGIRLRYIPGATTDPYGVATVEGLHPGRVDVTAYKTEERTLVKEVVLIPGGTTELAFDFGAASGSLEGFFTVEGKPVSDGRVEMYLYIDTPTGPERLVARAKSDGSYVFPEVPEGTAEMVVEARAGSGWFRRPHIHGIPIPADTVVRRDIDLTGTGVIEGWIDNVQGRSASIAVLEGDYSLGEAAEAMHFTDSVRPLAGFGLVQEDGSYTVEGLEPGTYTVVAVERAPVDWDILGYTGSTVVTVQNDETVAADFVLP